MYFVNGPFYEFAKDGLLSFIVKGLFRGGLWQAQESEMEVGEGQYQLNYQFNQQHHHQNNFDNHLFMNHHGHHLNQEHQDQFNHFSARQERRRRGWFVHDCLSCVIKKNKRKYEKRKRGKGKSTSWPTFPAAAISETNFLGAYLWCGAMIRAELWCASFEKKIRVCSRKEENQQTTKQQTTNQQTSYKTTNLSDKIARDIKL